jgi:Ca-activated chloride channel family protein
MRRILGVLVFVIAVASAGLAFSPQQQSQQPPPPPTTAGGAVQTPPIITKVSEVDVILAVVNHRQKFVTDLERTDFKIFEDNVQQEVRYFARQTELPLRVAILLDTSNSIRPRLQFEQDAAIDFIYDLLRPDRDLAFLMTFDSEPEVVQGYTNDLELLRNKISAQKAGGGTALYDAMVKASQMLVDAPPPKKGPPDFRRVLVVISDGEDNLSSNTRKDAIDTADRSGVLIYPISTSTEWIIPEESKDQNKKYDRKFAKTDGDKVLDAFATDTGGRAFFPYQVEDVAQSFMDIGTELRSQYMVGYSPVNGAIDGKFHKIRIEIIGHKELEVRSRKGYYAVPPVVVTRTTGGASGN